jgi:hypothetical protein
MKIFLISSAALALTLVSAPASAQLLGGGGGLSGGLGGQIGGGLGSGLGSGLGNPISRPELPRLPDRVDRKMDGSGQGVLSTKGKRRVDTKSGDVSASRFSPARSPVRGEPWNRFCAKPASGWNAFGSSTVT